MSAKPAVPPEVSWAADEAGTTGYLVSNAVSEVISQELKIPSKIISYPMVKDGNRSLARGESQLRIIATTIYYDEMRLIGPWDDPEFGPPGFRLVMNANMQVGSAVVRADSKIFKVPDLKGKTVALSDTYPSVAINAKAGLAFGGLTPDDVKIVHTKTLGEATKMVFEGKVDATYGSATTGPLVEYAVKPPGLRWLPLPHDDTEGWKRFGKVRPMLVKINFDKGIMTGKPLQTFAAIFMLVTMDFQSEEFVYQVAKTLHENYSKFKDKVTPLGTELITLEKTLNLENYNRILIPYHPGLIRLARELGLWTRQHDQYQAKALKDQEHWIAAWKAKYRK